MFRELPVFQAARTPLSTCFSSFTDFLGHHYVTQWMLLETAGVVRNHETVFASLLHMKRLSVISTSGYMKNSLGNQRKLPALKRIL